MQSRKYSSEGIVIQRKSVGEADRILTIFTRHFGKVKVLAKGVRKPKSRKRGHIEVFSRLSFSASELNGIDIMNEAQILDSFPDIRKDLKKAALAYFFAEVVGKLTHFGEENESLYVKVFQYFSLLGTASKLKSLRKEFVREILVVLGFWPDGRRLSDPDGLLEDISERKFNTKRVGLTMLQ